MTPNKRFGIPTRRSFMSAFVVGASAVGTTPAHARGASLQHVHRSRRSLSSPSGDGITDDTAALQAAIDSTPDKGTLSLAEPPVAYRVTASLRIRRSITISGAANKSAIKVDVPSETTAATALFSIESSDVTITNLWFTGKHRKDNPNGRLQANRYCIQAEADAGNRLERINVDSCWFTDLNDGWYSGTKLSLTDPNLLVTHGVYLAYVKDSHFTRNVVDDVSGSACFMRGSTNTSMTGNIIKNTGWFSLHYDGGDDDFDISNNTITGDRPDIRFWGASIDLMGQNEFGPSLLGRVHHNHVSGVHNYGNCGAIRVSSSNTVKIYENDFEDIRPGAVSGASRTSNIAIIAIHPRQARNLVNQPAPKHISIYDNRASAGAALQPFVLAQNGQSGDAYGHGPIDVGRGLSILRNVCTSIDSGRYFASLAMINGQDGGWSHIEISDNTCLGRPGNFGSVQAGLINLIAKVETEPIENIKVTGNSLTFDESIAGPAASDEEPSTRTGVSIGQFVTNINVTGNIISKFHYGVRAFKDSGCVSISDNTFSGNSRDVYDLSDCSSRAVDNA